MWLAELIAVNGSFSPYKNIIIYSNIVFDRSLFLLFMLALTEGCVFINLTYVKLSFAFVLIIPEDFSHYYN